MRTLDGEFPLSFHSLHSSVASISLHIWLVPNKVVESWTGLCCLWPRVQPRRLRQSGCGSRSSWRNHVCNRHTGLRQSGSQKLRRGIKMFLLPPFLHFSDPDGILSSRSMKGRQTLTLSPTAFFCSALFELFNRVYNAAQAPPSPTKEK